MVCFFFGNRKGGFPVFALADGGERSSRPARSPRRAGGTGVGFADAGVALREPRVGLVRAWRPAPPSRGRVLSLWWPERTNHPVGSVRQGGSSRKCRLHLGELHWPVFTGLLVFSRCPLFRTFNMRLLRPGRVFVFKGFSCAETTTRVTLEASPKCVRLNTQGAQLCTPALAAGNASQVTCAARVSPRAT